MTDTLQQQTLMCEKKDETAAKKYEPYRHLKTRWIIDIGCIECSSVHCTVQWMCVIKLEAVYSTQCNLNDMFNVSMECVRVYIFIPFSFDLARYPVLSLTFFLSFTLYFCHWHRDSSRVDELLKLLMLWLSRNVCIYMYRTVYFVPRRAMRTALCFPSLSIDWMQLTVNPFATR